MKKSRSCERSIQKGQGHEKGQKVRTKSPHVKVKSPCLAHLTNLWGWSRFLEDNSMISLIILSVIETSHQMVDISPNI
jgi:hypothetical protein